MSHNSAQKNITRLPRTAAVALLGTLLSVSFACTASDQSSAPEEPTAAESTAPTDAPVRLAEATTEAPANTAGGTPYEIDCSSGECLVDKATYVGWRTYHAACHVCHAQDAVGSSFAPSLLERLKQIDEERFYTSVNNGYTGQIGVMPAWGQDPNVKSKVAQLYAYLKARSDGVLAAGRPQRKR